MNISLFINKIRRVFIVSIISALCLCEAVYAGENSNIGESAIEEDSHTTEDTDLNNSEITNIRNIEIVKLPETIEYDCDSVSARVTDLTQKGISIEDAIVEAIGDEEYSVDDEWDRYSSYYLYNKLDTEHKIVWDVLNTMCHRAISCEEDLGSTDYRNALGFFTSSAFSSTEEIEIFLDSFKYSNPQYFFLTYESYMFEKDGVWTVSMCVYEDMIKASDRSNHKLIFEDAIEELESTIETSDNVLETVKSIHDAIITYAEYDYSEYNNSYVNEEVNHTQSAYSLLVDKKTVCAGYTLGFELICNNHNIGCIGIASTNHAWNLVRVNDTWFNVDCAWDRLADGRVIYDYFLKSDKSIRASDKKGDHRVEKIYSDYIESCIVDSDSRNVGNITIPEVSEVLSSPRIDLTVDGDQMKVSISADNKDAQIYYTINGRIPSQAFSKSLVYRGSFTVPAGSDIRAIAVKNGYRDSDIAETGFEQEKMRINVGEVTDTDFVNLTGQDESYRSSKSEVAAVDSEGNVTAKAEGKTTITATINDNKYSLVLYVYNPTIEGKSIVTKGKSIKLTVENGYGEVKWKSSDENIASVDDEGKVKAKNTGKVVIKAIVNGKIVKKTITVK